MTLSNNDTWAIKREALEAIMQDSARITGGSADIRAYVDEDIHPAGIVSVENGIATISISGPLMQSKPSGFWSFFFGGSSYEEIGAAVNDAAKRGDVRAILLNIESPGGVTSGIRELSRLIKSTQKPVYAYSAGMMTSAAYWIASAADKISIGSTAQVGSIGVIATHIDESRALENDGLKVSFITSGKFKAMGNSAEPLSTDAREYIQSRIDQIYGMFVSDISNHRGLKESNADVFADGRVFVGEAAKAVGLIDTVGISIDEFKNEIMEETAMDYQKLKAEHGDVFQKIYDEGVEAGAHKAVEDADAACNALLADTMGLVAAVAGEAVAKQIKALSDSGVKSGQIAAMKAAGLIKTADDDAEFKAKMLAAQAAGNPPLNPDAARDPEPDFMAMVDEHVKQAGCKRSMAMAEVQKKHPGAHAKWLKAQQK